MSTKQPPLSLLSLSMAAACAQPIPIADPSGDDPDSVGSISVGSPHSLGLGNLSLGSSSSPPPVSRGKVTQIGFSVDDSASENGGGEGTSPPPGRVFVAPIPISKSGKKRGMDHKCESCDKIYRHPSCLIKHRWEHTPHWRESSKYVLSKHQQVQLLEAAAILSHLKPGEESTSLPDDRSLWPSFLSGGSLPKQIDGAAGSAILGGVTSTPHPPYTYDTGTRANTAAKSLSTSVPATSFLAANAKGPAAKTFELPQGGAVEVRPGVVGVAHPTSVSVPASSGNASNRRHRSSRSLSGRDEVLGLSKSIPMPVPTSRYGTRGYYKRSGSVLSTSAVSASVLSSSSVAEEEQDQDMEEEEEEEDDDIEVEVETEPPAHSTSVPSITYSSSRSRSGSRSMSPRSDSDIDVDADVDEDERHGQRLLESKATIHPSHSGYEPDDYASPSSYSYGKESSVRGGPASKWDEEMEMEMEMD